MVPYVDAVGDVTVMRVLLFALRECDCDGHADVGVVVVSAWHVGGTHGLGIVSSAAHVL